MTVKELIAQLRELPEDYEVIMSKDAEGNGYSPLYNVWTGDYKEDSSYSGTMITEEDGEEYGYESDNAVVLSPTN